MGEAQGTNAPAQDGKQTTDTTSGGGDAFKPITSQDELNRVLGDRLERERAKFADYADLQARAAKLDELEAANKSEIEKATDARTAAESERDEAKAEALRLRVAVKHGMSLEDADLFLTGSDEATLTKQAERLAERTSTRKTNGNVVPKEGASTQPQDDEGRAFARQLFARGD